MAGPIRKVGPFTESVRSETTDADMWHRLDRTYDEAPGATQHHNRVKRREDMGQKMTPKDDVRNIKRGRK